MRFTCGVDWESPEVQNKSELWRLKLEQGFHKRLFGPEKKIEWLQNGKNCTVLDIWQQDKNLIALKSNKEEKLDQCKNN